MDKLHILGYFPNQLGGKSDQSRIVLQGLESKQKRIVRGNPSLAGYLSEVFLITVCCPHSMLSPRGQLSYFLYVVPITCCHHGDNINLNIFQIKMQYSLSINKVITFGGKKLPLPTPLVIISELQQSTDKTTLVTKYDLTLKTS